MFSLLPPLIIPLNSKILNFFGFRHSFRGLTPLKPKNFDQQFKFFIITQIFAQRSSLDILINTSLHNIVELENLFFFWISSLISWANSCKTQEFRPKIENFHHHSKIFTMFILRCFNYYLPSSYHCTRKFEIFLDFVTHFVVTPLKPKNFDQKL